MSTHQVAIGADVRSNEGRSIGKVEHLIVDGDTKHLKAFVADKGIFDSGRVVDIEYVRAVNDDVVTLRLSEGEALDLPGFVEHQFFRFGDTTGFPAGGGANVNLGSSGGTWMHYGPGEGGLPSTGSHSFFEPGVIGDVSAHTMGPLTDSELALDHGTDVVDATGDKIGVVDEVMFSDDNAITGFVVRQGLVFHHDVYVPVEWVAGITHEHVRLSVGKDDVEQSKR